MLIPNRILQRRLVWLKNRFLEKPTMKSAMLAFGTRPEAIKICPLVIELETRTKNTDGCLCHGLTSPNAGSGA